MQWILRRIVTALIMVAIITTGLTFPHAVVAAYPDKPITIIVPRSAGGGSDQLSRLIVPEWAKRLKTVIVIDNVPGAGGAIALAQAFRRPPDGYTIIVWSPPSEYVLQLQGRIQSTVDDWVQIGATNSDPGVVAVATNSRFKSFKDILDASRSSEKRLSVGTIGRTTGSALSAMMYQTALKVRWGIVPFDGGGDVTTALIGGHVDFALRQGGMYEFHPSKLRILAIANKVRIKELPDVPTIKEATGVEIVYSAYRGFAVRNGTPDNILDLLRATFAEAAKAPAVADKQFDTSGFRYELLDGNAFQAESKKQAQIVERYKREILGK